MEPEDVTQEEAIEEPEDDVEEENLTSSAGNNISRPSARPSDRQRRGALIGVDDEDEDDIFAATLARIRREREELE